MLEAPVAAWPRSVPRIFRPFASLPGPRTPEEYAYMVQARRERVKAAIDSPVYGHCFWSNKAAFTAVASTNAEAGLFQGQNSQPWIPKNFFNGPAAAGRTIQLRAKGVFSTTGTPTLTFQARMGTTASVTNYGGTSIGVSSAITSASGVSNKFWELGLDITCFTPGQGSNNLTLCSSGYVMSQSGFGTPFNYPLEVTAPDTATWTNTFDASLDYYLQLSMTWSASSSSNSIQCIQAWAFSWN